MVSETTKTHNLSLKNNFQNCFVLFLRLSKSFDKMAKYDSTYEEIELNIPCKIKKEEGEDSETEFLAEYNCFYCNICFESYVDWKSHMMDHES